MRYHLLMSDTAFKRDIDDPQDHRDFAALVQSPERLQAAAGADRRRHPRRRAEGVERLEGGAAARALPRAPSRSCRAARCRGGRAERIKPIQGEVSRAPRRLDRGREGRAFRARLRALLAVVRSRDAGPPGRAGAPRRARAPPLAIEHRIDGERVGHRDDDLHARHPGLFARLAGAMAVSGANIVDAKIFTLANGMALDTFWVQDLEGKPFDGPSSWRGSPPASRSRSPTALDIAARARQPARLFPSATSVFTVSRAC